MQTKIIEQIKTTLPDADVRLEGEGCNFTATIICAEFTGKNPVQRQQLVYQAIKTLIASGEVHAISMHTYTPTEWEAQHG